MRLDRTYGPRVSIERSVRLDQVIAASALFDDPVRPEAAVRFLDELGHHLLVATDDHGQPVGMVSGVELTHPDKGTEMFLYELGVDSASRGQGIGRALVEALVEVARARGCYGMWVLTDEENRAAMATYRAAGGVDPTITTMITWTLDQGEDVDSG